MDLALSQADAPSEPGVQRRQSPRRKVMKGALILFQRGQCSMRCRILDLSDSGALLDPMDVMLCPSEFVLKLDVGEPRNCEVRWRTPERLGVHFF
jgi:hypothetical protein